MSFCSAWFCLTPVAAFLEEAVKILTVTCTAVTYRQGMSHCLIICIIACHGRAAQFILWYWMAFTVVKVCATFFSKWLILLSTHLSWMVKLKRLVRNRLQDELRKIVQEQLAPKLPLALYTQNNNDMRRLVWNLHIQAPQRMNPVIQHHSQDGWWF